MDIIIIGCTSNICKIRVFENLNRIQKKINKVYCVSSRKYTKESWKLYVKGLNNISKDILDKMDYIECGYNLKDYKLKLINIINNSTFIYVSTPPSCYKDLILFVNDIQKGNLILEKPLAINTSEFFEIKPLINERIILIDHFIFKRDIMNIIESNIKDIKKIKFVFLYDDDVEERLGYFDKVGFFIDMFQSHFLSILYLLIGESINNIFDAKIHIDRKQYVNYGGNNKNADTYFNLKMEFDNIHIQMEAGKAMKNKKKQIIINEKIFDIGDYKDEYTLFFENLIENKNKNNIIKKQEKFWKITDFLKLHFKEISFYDKNKFSGEIKNL
jgi:glucose-6-phosphate 1-dehydrogenase